MHARLQDVQETEWADGTQPDALQPDASVRTGDGVHIGSEHGLLARGDAVPRDPAHDGAASAKRGRGLPTGTVTSR